MKKRIYLDYAAATPCDPHVLKAMQPFWNKDFGNAGSLHQEGVKAKEALEEARSRIARALDAHDNEIIFTSGGTEANNLAIFGVVNALKEKGRSYAGMHVVTSIIEHPSVLDCFKELERRGVSVAYVGVDENGLIDPREVQAALQPSTVLVSLMYINNEIGTIQPIPKISKIIKNFRETISYKLKAKSSKAALPLFHTDASQAPLYLNCSVNRLGVDLMTVDAQKIYGPKGVGFLYKRNTVLLNALFCGGNQEFSLRPGTENIPLIVGLSEALARAGNSREKECIRLLKLRDYFIAELLKKVPGTFLNGHRVERVVNNVNISIPGIDAEYLVLYLDSKGIAIGTRSACIAGEGKASYVISALGRTDGSENSSLRFSLGKHTTKKDLVIVIRVLAEAALKLDKN